MNKSIIKTIVCVILLVVLASPEIGGGALGIMVFFAWAIYTLINFIVSLQSGKKWGIRVACWLLGWGILYVMHHVYNQNAREYGNQIISELNQYYQQHQRYPSSQEWLGQNRPNKYRLRYICLQKCEKNQSKPIVLYSSSLSPFDRYFYDFETQNWQYRPD